MMVLGFFSATIVYLVLMLWKGAGMRPVAALGLAVAMAAFMSMFGGYIGLVFPLGYLDSAVLALFGSYGGRRDAPGYVEPPRGRPDRGSGTGSAAVRGLSGRSAERSAGNEWVRTCSYRGGL